MTFALQILIASIIFCVMILLVLGIQKKGYLKHKAFGVLMLMASVLFLCGALFYGYIEFTTYKKRAQRYTKQDNNIVEELADASVNEAELQAFKYFHNYRNALNGYEYFLINMSQNSDQEQASYLYTLQNKIVEQFKSEEYSQDYWNKVFAIVFQQKDSSALYLKSNYEVLYIIPADHEYRELENDYGDLNDAKNYSYFETLCNLLYIEGKIKDFNSRSAERMETLWQYNKAFIYTFFSKTKYDQLCKQVVDDLITVHDRIIAQPNYKTFYEQYDVSDKEFLDFPSKEFTSTYKFSWPFSFWDRRFNENNSEQVYSILKEIQEHYSN